MTLKIIRFVKCKSTNICATFRTVSSDTARRAVPRRCAVSFLYFYLSTQFVSTLHNTGHSGEIKESVVANVHTTYFYYKPIIVASEHQPCLRVF